MQMGSGSTLKEPTLPLVLPDESTPGGDIFEGDVVNFSSQAPKIDAGLPPTFNLDTIAPAPPNALLGEYLRRPVVLHTFSWTGGSSSFHIDPWALYLNDASVVPKLANFRYFRGTLHVSVQLNGTPFHFGRYGVSYEPTNWNRASVDGDFRHHSGNQHVLVDPGANTIADFKCPYVSPFNWIDLTGGANSVRVSGATTIDSDRTAALGVLNFDLVAPLAIFQGGTPSAVEVIVYGWMEDYQLAMPTTEAQIPFVPQSGDEYSVQSNSGLISGPSAVVAGIAKRLVGAPYIGPFAQATAIAASGVSAIAKLFGYSRPRDLHGPKVMVQGVTGNMPSGDMEDSTVSLTINSKSELALGSGVTGFDPGCDELSVQAIASRWTYMSTVTWSSTNVTGSELVHRGVGPRMFTSLNVSPNFLLSSLAFASLPFRWWHGSIEVKVVIVCSRFHRGRLRFMWAPMGAGSELNQTYTEIVDISSATEYCITLPYVCPEGYKEVGEYAGTGTYLRRFDSGTFQVMVANKLVCPTTEPVRLLFFVRAGSDYRVAAPDPYSTRMATFYNTSDEAALLREQTEDVLIERQSGAVTELGMAASVDCVPIVFKPTSTIPNYDLAYFADPVVSFRPLLKRYTEVTVLGYGNITPTYVSTSISMGFSPFPQSFKQDDGGIWLGAGPVTRYTLCYTHLACYLGYAFLGKRGSFRTIVDLDQGVDEVDSLSSLRAGRRPIEIGETYPKYYFNREVTATPDAIGPLTFNIDAHLLNGSSGMQLFPFSPHTQRAGVECPFYAPIKYISAVEPGPFYGGNIPTLAPDNFEQLLVQYTVLRRTTAVATTITHIKCPVYQAAGEDFNLFFYRGIPQLKLGVVGAFSTGELSSAYVSDTG